MARKKHQLPSMTQFAKKHPSFTVHLDEKQYNDISEYAFNTKKIIALVIKEAVGLFQKE